MAVTYRELISALQEAGLRPNLPVIAHASLSAFGEVRGGADALVGALLASTAGVIMPTFTYKTMVVPETGPEGNALEYGRNPGANRLAELYTPDIPADRLMGVTAEALRRHPQARRSIHPILSFAGVGAATALERQTLAEPLAPIGALTEAGGLALLLGVDHTANTSIHYAERRAGRRQFVRWALTLQGAKECPGFPGCSSGFNAIAPRLGGIQRRVRVGNAWITAVPLSDLMRTVENMLAEDPLALLCSRAECPRCSAVRQSIPV